MSGVTNSLIALRVADPEVSLRFYVEGLGLQVHDQGRRDWIELVVGGRLFVLATGASPEASPIPPEFGAPPAGSLVAFKTDDLDATVKRAIQFGGTLAQSPEAEPHGRMALLRDPDGHAVVLHEPSEPQPHW